MVEGLSHGGWCPIAWACVTVQAPTPARLDCPHRPMRMHARAPQAVSSQTAAMSCTRTGFQAACRCHGGRAGARTGHCGMCWPARPGACVVYTFPLITTSRRPRMTCHAGSARHGELQYKLDVDVER